MGETLPLRDRRGYATFPSAPDVSKPHESPLRSSSWLSRLLLAYVDPLLATGRTRQLETSDFWPLDREHQAEVTSQAFADEFRKRGQSILATIARLYGGVIMLAGAAALFAAAVGVLAPVVLHHVVDAVAAPQMDVAADLGLWLGLFFASKLANALVSAHAGMVLQIGAAKIECALRALLYAKALRRSAQGKAVDGDEAEKAEAAEGEQAPKQTSNQPPADLANLISNDVSSMLYAVIQINNLWILPLQIGVVVYLLYAVLGVAAFVGLGIIVASMLVSFFIFLSVGCAYEDIMARKDARMKAVKEVFGAIQVVKLNAWEDKFAARIAALRAKELSAVARFVYTISATVFILWASPILVSTVSFAVYALVLKQPLTAAKVFTTIALFNAIREPLRQLPTLLQMSIQAAVSLGRINAYLALPEYDSDNVTRVPKDDASGVLPAGACIAVRDAAFGWAADAPTLQNVQLEVQHGDLVVVHGSVGSGKSTLCMALLGETLKLRGSVAVRGSVAYYSQQTWIQNKSLRDNILFGRPLEHARYEAVLDACGLRPDLEQLAAGDATEIGQKGVNLSGGQKARVCLARACYADADVYVLDSPLAAVDAVVQSEIFRKCICGLLKDKTVVLVTHNPEIVASKAANVKVLVADGGERVVVTRDELERPRSEYAVLETEQRDAKDAEAFGSKGEADEAGRLVIDEERVEGRVSKRVYWAYLEALGGVKVCVLLLLVQVLWQGCQIGSDLWLSRWTSQRGGQDAQELADTGYYMTVYALLCAGAALMVLLRVVGIAFVGLRASRHLFDGMTTALLHAPLRFFDTNPIGRIVNRYGDDLSSVDLSLQFAYGTVLAYAFFTTFQLATAVYMVSFLGVLIVPLLAVYVRVADLFLASSREVARHLRVSDSPLLSQVTQSEEGVQVLRAFGKRAVETAVAENYALIDGVLRVFVVNTATQQWFSLRIELIGCGVVTLVVSSLIYLRAVLSPGLVGLAFTYALSVDEGLGGLVQIWSWLEIQMVSPERLLEYTAIPAEGCSSAGEPLEPPATWPEHGDIEFSRVAFRYADAGESLVLKDVSFRIAGREKVGIVGRTGAGKSSLTMALFRTNELVAGRISIDGVDISTVPLRALRSRMTIIPQSPVLFKGPLRRYLDPFDEFSDADVWSSLERVDMKTAVGALDGKLQHELSENGDNLSVGERQLLCMARALLTKSRIVVMDEATASIDHATEKKLQQMIARDFKEATVLTIAHRLATVLNSDRIMVLSDGKVVEFDAPRVLAANEASAFHQLAKEGGYLDKLLAE